MDRTPRGARRQQPPALVERWDGWPGIDKEIEEVVQSYSARQSPETKHQSLPYMYIRGVGLQNCGTGTMWRENVSDPHRCILIMAGSVAYVASGKTISWDLHNHIWAARTIIGMDLNSHQTNLRVSATNGEAECFVQIFKHALKASQEPRRQH